MASTLSHSAIHRIISLSLGGPKWYPSYTLTDVHSKWKAIHDLYTDVRPAPPLDYLDSLELALVLKGQVDDGDIRYIFAHGKPLKFWGWPPQLVPKIVEGGGCVRRFSGFYWVEIRHLQRDLSYADMRRFKIPSPAGVEGDCDLIRHYLSNSHVADLRPPGSCFPFSIKMLAALASRNFSVGHVCLDTNDDDRLSDYRSMDAIFGGMRLSSLDLSCEESRFVELVKTTDFYRTPTVQRLRELKLTLKQEPALLSGIFLLRNCAFYRVDYSPDRHLRTVERKMVQLCEDFERGRITDTVEHFRLKTPGIDYAFRRDNLLVAGMKVDGKKHEYGTTSIYEWDVYRFRNAATNDYLTACVAHYKAVHFNGTLLHISKGEVFPDASFADF
ncbi:hypothetical protein AAVH_15897 [Aphelenchoides avenae]|nr:hypothetical protein AAVH_15897 [Aphelenchus avenae]